MFHILGTLQYGQPFHVWFLFLENKRGEDVSVKFDQYTTTGHGFNKMVSLDTRLN